MQTYMNPSVTRNQRLRDRDIVVLNHVLSVTGGGEREFFQSLSTIVEKALPWMKVSKSSMSSVSSSLKRLCEYSILKEVKSGGGVVSSYVVSEPPLKLRDPEEQPTLKIEGPLKIDPPQISPKPPLDLTETTPKFGPNHPQNWGTINTSSNTFKKTLGKARERASCSPPDFLKKETSERAAEAAAQRELQADHTTSEVLGANSEPAKVSEHLRVSKDTSVSKKPSHGDLNALHEPLSFYQQVAARYLSSPGASASDLVKPDEPKTYGRTSYDSKASDLQSVGDVLSALNFS